MRMIRAAVIIILCYVTASLLFFPHATVTAAQSSLILCFEAVIPTLFPFFVCSSLFIDLGMAEVASKFLSRIMKPLFGVNGSSAIAFVLGIISGYPIGADCAAKLYKSEKISKEEAQRLIGFCNNSGPLFIIGTVGFAMNNSKNLGIVIYLIHIISSIISGVLLSRLTCHRETKHPIVLKNKSENSVKTISSAFGSAVKDSVFKVLAVCGFVVFFSVIESTVPSFKYHEFLNSILEITGGISGVSKMSIEPVLKVSLISMFLAFSGISVFLQVASVVTNTDLSLKEYAVGKLIQGIVAFSITYVIFSILKALSRLNDFIPAFSEAFYMTPDFSYMYYTPWLDMKKYIILMIGEILWCFLSIGILMLIAKFMSRFEN